MASAILPSPSTSTSLPTYRLPEAVRLAIIAESLGAKQRADIERQRLAFVQKFGNQFGL